MKFSYHLPVEHHHKPDEFHTAAAIAEIAQTAEAEGYEACFLTDHPIPEAQWVAHGGHHALDPFTALAFAAAVTTKIKVHTNILVLPYRNPFVVAKAVATLDRLSGGRFIMGIGSGYLEPEFKALNVPLKGRGDLMDEYIEAMKLAWTGEPVHMTGSNFDAQGVAARPTPIQDPHPPIWVGGNGGRAMRRAAQMCDGWSPFAISEEYKKNVRTEAIEGIDDLKNKFAEVLDLVAATGRTRPFDFCVSPFALATAPRKRPEAQVLIDDLGALAQIGVNWSTISLHCRDRAECLDNARWFASEVRAKL